MQDKTLDGVTFISTTPITTEPMARCCGNALNGATFISTMPNQVLGGISTVVSMP